MHVAIVNDSEQSRIEAILIDKVGKMMWENHAKMPPKPCQNIRKVWHSLQMF
jgi:hypothetical protein